MSTFLLYLSYALEIAAVLLLVLMFTPVIKGSFKKACCFLLVVKFVPLCAFFCVTLSYSIDTDNGIPRNHSDYNPLERYFGFKDPAEAMSERPPDAKAIFLQH